MVGAWAVSRTLGLPVGPDAAGPEAAGVLDVLATVNEIAVVGLALWFSPRSTRPSDGGGRSGAVRLLRVAVLLLILLSSMLLSGGLHAH